MYTHSNFLPVDAELDRQLDVVIHDVGLVPGAGLDVIEFPSLETTAELRTVLLAALHSVDSLGALLGPRNGAQIVC